MRTFLKRNFSFVENPIPVAKTVQISTKKKSSSAENFLHLTTWPFKKSTLKLPEVNVIYCYLLLLEFWLTVALLW